MRILVWLFIASAVFVGVQVVWIVFIRNRDGYNITEQDAITRQTLALVFVLMLVQFRRGYDIAETAGYVWALFLYDLIWCGVCFFAGWSAVQHRVFVLFDVIRANFKPFAHNLPLFTLVKKRIVLEN